MMKHLATGAVLACLIALATAACDTSGDDYPQGVSACSAFSSCETCTPVNGCGWCFNSDGTANCASGPGGCTSTTFEWAWDPSDCPTADAGVSSDAASTADASETGAPLEAASTAADTAATDAVGATSDSESADADAALDSGAPDVVADQSEPVDADATPGLAVADGGGCIPNDGALCGESQPYGFTCTSHDPADSAIAAPAPSLECAVASVPTPTGVLFYCCAGP
ncbi:MAG: hypothetical protein ABSF69_05800 [Polyangiaceae bacterium]|jgi:hypothetical protein